MFMNNKELRGLKMTGIEIILVIIHLTIILYDLYNKMKH